MEFEDVYPIGQVGHNWTSALAAPASTWKLGTSLPWFQVTWTIWRGTGAIAEAGAWASCVTGMGNRMDLLWVQGFSGFPGIPWNTCSLKIE